MSTEIKFPKSGMGIAEGTVVRWHKAVGENVTQGEVIVDIETAKAIDEIITPVSGVLKRIVVHEGESVEANSTLGVIDEINNE